MSGRFDPYRLMAEYKAAHEMANPDRKAPRITYAGGWFTMTLDAFGRGNKYRRLDLERMRDRLLARARGETP